MNSSAEDGKKVRPVRIDCSDAHARSSRFQGAARIRDVPRPAGGHPLPPAHQRARGASSVFQSQTRGARRAPLHHGRLGGTKSAQKLETARCSSPAAQGVSTTFPHPHIQPAQPGA